MIDQNSQDASDFGLPPSVIREAANEYLIKYLFVELERFFAMAIPALSMDCEISEDESEAILWQRFQALVKGLKMGQAKQSHAAIFCKMFWMLEGLELAAPYQVGNSYNPSNDDNQDSEGGVTEAA
jgi:hypothetical protein